MVTATGPWLLCNQPSIGDATTLPNVVTATLPKNGTYLVAVSELLKKSGKFKGAYQVSLRSSKNAWTTFAPR